jgi:hypothetical protein
MSDAGIAVQLFGTAMNGIVADNRSIRAGGMRAWALNYESGFQPTWYVQFLNNDIAGSGAWGDSHLAVISSSQGEYKGALARFVVMRENRLDQNTRIEIQGPAADVVVERNRIARSTTGIKIVDSIPLAPDEFKDATGKSSGIMLRKNEFVDVEAMTVGEGASRALVAP